jgi:hypothetical protein
MKQSFLQNLISVLIYTAFVLMLATLISCGDSKRPEIQKPSVRRVHVLENGSISYVIIRPSLDSVYKCHDTVWVNLLAHRIDDQDTTAMLCVLEK